MKIFNVLVYRILAFLGNSPQKNFSHIKDTLDMYPSTLNNFLKELEKEKIIVKKTENGYIIYELSPYGLNVYELLQQLNLVINSNKK